MKNKLKLFNLENLLTKMILMPKCSYCGHQQCNRCLSETSSSKPGYCCQCHRTNVMK